MNVVVWISENVIQDTSAKDTFTIADNSCVCVFVSLSVRLRVCLIVCVYVLRILRRPSYCLPRTSADTVTGCQSSTRVSETVLQCLTKICTN